MDRGEYRPEYYGRYEIPPPVHGLPDPEPPAPDGPKDDKPDKNEKKRIRKLYNSVGLAMIAEEILIYFLVFALYAVFSGIITEEETAEGLRLVNFPEAAIMFCAPAAAAVIMSFIYNGIKKVPLPSLFSVSGFNAPFVIKSIAAVFLFHQTGIILEYIIMFALDSAGYGVPSLNYETAHDLPTLAADVLSSVILAPIAEEMFFRGIVLKETAKVSGRFAIFFSALMFGMMHGNIYQAVMATIVGIALGYITLKAKSVIPAIICHMSMNFMMSLTDIAEYFNEELGDVLYFMISAAELAIGIIGFAVILKTDGISFPPYTAYHKKRTLPIILTSLPVIIITVIYIFHIALGIEPLEEAEEFIESAARFIKL